jgi:hypothetical protein
MVTDGHQRPEIPPQQACPSAPFPGMGKYVELMQNCWKQVRSGDDGPLPLCWCSGLCDARPPRSRPLWAVHNARTDVHRRDTTRLCIQGVPMLLSQVLRRRAITGPSYSPEA